MCFPPVAALLAAALLSSCAVPAMEVLPSIVPPSEFSRQGQAAPGERWWLAFDDPRLADLVDRALSGNFSLESAWRRLAQAKEAAGIAALPLLPNVDASAGASRTRTVADAPVPGGGGKTKNTTTYRENYSLGLAASYEVDLWGRIRAGRDAARLDALASEEDLRAAAVTLTAEVARTWFQLVEQHGHLRLLDGQIATNEKHLEVITFRFRRGRAAAPDVLQQRQLVESVRGERSLTLASAKTLEHALAVLVGQPPGSLHIAVADTLPGLPPLPRPGIPADCLRRRPDVRAAEMRVQSADKRTAEAIADRFPRLTLSGRADASAGSAGDLFHNWAATMAANIAAPVFDGGRRRGEVRRRREVVAERLSNYAQILLVALKEVEDALEREARQAEYAASLAKQLDLSEKSTAQVLENYTKGTMNFTRYLTTLLAHQNLQRNALRAERALLEYRVDLHRAIAGAWALPEPEDPDGLALARGGRGGVDGVDE